LAELHPDRTWKPGQVEVLGDHWTNEELTDLYRRKHPELEEQEVIVAVLGCRS
jgi:hypothetical protein